jgi:hypothetical protein
MLLGCDPEPFEQAFRLLHNYGHSWKSADQPLSEPSDDLPAISE